MATSFMTMPISNTFSSGGSGKFKPLKRNNYHEEYEDQDSFDPFEPKYNRMAFKSSTDPVYMAFDYVENQSLSKITSDFIQENIKYPINKLYEKLTHTSA
jgi:hypothetical protein